MQQSETWFILLSDGQDNLTGRNYINLVPPSFRAAGAGNGNRPVQIHTSGSHDAAAMHTVAKATRGMFSYIENQEVIRHSFPQCIDVRHAERAH